ncbi:hypothetical protein U1Q18_048357 [Sarracenia purpurea var. burkii]
MPPPSIIPPVATKSTKESSPSTSNVAAEPQQPVIEAEKPKESDVETTPVVSTEESESIVSEKLPPQITIDEAKDAVPTSEISIPDVAIEKSEDSAETFEKPETEVEAEIPKDSCTSFDASIEETTPLVKTEELEEPPVTVEKSVPEASAKEPVPTVEEPENSPVSVEKSTIETPSIETDESVTSETDVEIKTETQEDPIVDTVAATPVDSTTAESQTEPETSSTKTFTELEPVPVFKAVVTEPEEGEIDLSTIEPADEDSPALPDTSVILAAMKETMRQTDAVISTMPIAVSTGKKRKRDDHAAKCKKCGIKVEMSTNTAPICDSCTEIPVKKSKPVAPTPPPPPPAPKNRNFRLQAAAAASAAATAPTPVAPVVPVIKVDKPAPKKCSPKLKETRIQPPPPFRCRKCDSIGLAPPDGSTFCEKCSRLQETVCLLCKSSYISDTNDKVCGKCMLAGSSKQKKRIVDNDATPAIVTSTNSTKTCTCKRRSSGQPDRAEVVCDKCNKSWRDEENSGSTICRTCRMTTFDSKICKTPLKSDVAVRGVQEHSDSIRCLDCSIVVVPTLAEAALRKLCDGCSMRRDERRSSSEIRYLDTVNAVARAGLAVQRSPNVFSGFASAADDAARSKLEDMRVEHRKEEERSVPVVGSVPAAAAAPTTEHKTPMKNVKLICRVSSYKYHCDNCKHRSNEKKPLLSFAKRTTKGGPESTSQAEPTNGASFEILEGDRNPIKPKLARKTSQIPLVVYESDSSPMKKSDGSRALKKIKRTHSSPETIMDTIESVIKSICYDTPESGSEQDDKTLVKEAAAEISDRQQQPENTKLESEEPLKVSIDNLKPEPKDDDGNTQPENNDKPAKKSASRSKSRSKKASRKRRPTAKKARKSGPEEAPGADEAAKSDVEAEKAVKSEPIEVKKEMDVDVVEKPSKKSPSPAPPSRRVQYDQFSNARGKEVRRSRRRTCATAVPPARALRSRTKFYESLNDFKDTEIEEPEPESMDVVDERKTETPPPAEPSQEAEKPNPPPKAAAKRGKANRAKATLRNRDRIRTI